MRTQAKDSTLSIAWRREVYKEGELDGHFSADGERPSSDQTDAKIV